MLEDSAKMFDAAAESFLQKHACIGVRGLHLFGAS